MVTGLTMPSVAEREIAQGLVTLLSPFEKTSIILQSQKRPSASLVVPMVYYLKTFFDELDDPQNVILNSVKGLLGAGIEEKFGRFFNYEENREFCKPYFLATITDWRTKSMSFASGNLPLQQHIATTLLHEIQQLPGQPAAPAPAAFPPPAQQDDLSEFICGPAPPPQIQVPTIESQVMAFLDTPGLADIKADPSPTWLAQKANFPDVFRVYCKYACVQGATAIAEQLFSATGVLHERKRCRWKPENMHNLVFCSKNGQEIAKIEGEDGDVDDAEPNE
jgi:hypothetical protein